MKMRVFLALMASAFLTAGCFSSSSSDDDDPSSDLSDRDRAEAAASASILSGALENPDDDDDDGGGYGPMSNLSHAAHAASEMCDSGSMEEGETANADVNSPYTDDGTMDIRWSYYQGCVQGEGEDFEMTTDGYQQQSLAWDSDAHFFRWAATPDDAMGSEGDFVMDSSFGAFRFSGYMHECDGDTCLEPNQFGSTGYVNWNIQSGDEEVTFGFGRANEPMVIEGERLGNDAEQSIDGFYSLNWSGTECNIEVDYETIEPLYFANYQTRDEVIMSGRMNMSVNESSFEVEFIEGEAFIDGEPIEPDEDNPCAGAFDIGFGF